MKHAPDLIRGPGAAVAHYAALHAGYNGARATLRLWRSTRVPPGGQEGGRPGMVFEEATPTTPKPAEPHGTQEMRRT